MGSTPVSLSASRGAGILGVSKYKSPVVAWLEIMEDMQPGFCAGNDFKLPDRVDAWAEPLDPKSASMRWGLAFEDGITDLVGGITDREAFHRHPEYEFITCHLDGKKGIRNQENKTAFLMAYEAGWGEPGTAMVPEMYQVQIQHQMMCSGAKDTDVNVLVFPKAPAKWEAEGYKIYQAGDIYLNDSFHSDTFGFIESLKSLGFFHTYPCPADPRAQAAILERYRAFWSDNVLKETPPPVKGYDDIKWLIPSPEGEIEATEPIRELWSEFVDIDEEIESMLVRRDEIRDIMAQFIQKSTPKEAAEKGKLKIYAGSRGIATLTKKQFRINKPKKEK